MDTGQAQTELGAAEGQISESVEDFSIEDISLFRKSGNLCFEISCFAAFRRTFYSYHCLIEPEIYYWLNFI